MDTSAFLGPHGRSGAVSLAAYPAGNTSASTNPSPKGAGPEEEGRADFRGSLICGMESFVQEALLVSTTGCLPLQRAE